MFTGLVQAVGRIRTVAASPVGVRLEIDVGGWAYRPEIGASVCVSGVCLTVTGIATGAGGATSLWMFDVVPETLKKTTAGGLRAGAKVNLEQSLAANGLLGGHFVQGHVDGVGKITRVQRTGEWRVTLRPPAEIMACMTPKGSVALDGVSLTIAEVSVDRGEIEVALIPETLAKTTLADWQEGDGVNIEADMLAKTVVNVLRNFQGRVGGVNGAAGAALGMATDIGAVEKGGGT